MKCSLPPASWAVDAETIVLSSSSFSTLHSWPWHVATVLWSVCLCRSFRVTSFLLDLIVYMNRSLWDDMRTLLTILISLARTFSLQTIQLCVLSAYLWAHLHGALTNESTRWTASGHTNVGTGNVRGFVWNKKCYNFRNLHGLTSSVHGNHA